MKKLLPILWIGALCSPLSAQTDDQVIADMLANAGRHQYVSYKDSIWMIGHATVNSMDINVVLRSEDGDAWEVVTSNAPFLIGSRFHAAIYKDKIWGIEDGNIWHTTDGVHWTNTGKQAPVWNYFTFVVYKDTLWIIGGTSPTHPWIGFNKVWYSTNGEDWALATSQLATTGRKGFISPEVLVFKGRMYLFSGAENELGGGRNNRYVYVSLDGRQWDAYTFPYMNTELGYGTAFFVHDDKLYALARTRDLHRQYAAFSVLHGTSSALFVSEDGRHWGIHSQGFYDHLEEIQQPRVYHKGEVVFFSNMHGKSVFSLPVPEVSYVPDQYVLADGMDVMDIPVTIQHPSDAGVQDFSIAVMSSDSTVLSADSISHVRNGDDHFLRLRQHDDRMAGEYAKITVSISAAGARYAQSFDYQVIGNTRLYLLPDREDWHYETGERDGELIRNYVHRYVSDGYRGRAYSFRVVNASITVNAHNFLGVFYKVIASTASAGRATLEASVEWSDESLTSTQRFDIVVDDPSNLPMGDKSNSNAFEIALGGGGGPTVPAIALVVDESAEALSGTLVSARANPLVIRGLLASADSVEVEVTVLPADLSWTVSDGAADWIRLEEAATGGDRGDNTLSMRGNKRVLAIYTENATMSTRRATLTFTAMGAGNKELQLTQSGTPPDPPIPPDPTVSLTGTQSDTFPGLEVYPNPVGDRLWVSVGEGVVLRLLSMDGRLLALHTLSAGQRHEIDLSSYREGAYLLELQGSRGRVLRRLVLR